ncbi:MAG: AzlC family ABC transporter permease [Desulfotomaculum sp.]|nr:AzlC family ABC transporter permease [Desulfotomaculum sp.]
MNPHLAGKGEGGHGPVSGIKYFYIIEGFKSGIPIAIGYIPIALAFGLLAKTAGIPAVIASLMSFLVFAGASQFVAVNLMILGTAPWEIILTTFILNLRHLLMSASLSTRLNKNMSKTLKAVLAFGITDETFSVASFSRKPVLSPGFILGLNFTAFAAWNIGTWGGIFLAAGLPETIKTSMGIALYAMFIGLLVPTLKNSKQYMAVALAAAGIHSALRYIPLFSALSSGWSIVISAVAAAAAGAVFLTEEGSR